MTHGRGISIGDAAYTQTVAMNAGARGDIERRLLCGTPLVGEGKWSSRHPIKVGNKVKSRLRYFQAERRGVEEVHGVSIDHPFKSLQTPTCTGL